MSFTKAILTSRNTYVVEYRRSFELYKRGRASARIRVTRAAIPLRTNNAILILELDKAHRKRSSEVVKTWGRGSSYAEGQESGVRFFNMCWLFRLIVGEVLSFDRVLVVQMTRIVITYWQKHRIEEYLDTRTSLARICGSLVKQTAHVLRNFFHLKVSTQLSQFVFATIAGAAIHASSLQGCQAHLLLKLSVS